MFGIDDVNLVNLRLEYNISFLDILNYDYMQRFSSSINFVKNNMDNTRNLTGYKIPSGEL